MKRSRQSGAQAFVDLLAMLPPWLTVILGVVAYFVIQWVPGVLTGQYHTVGVGVAPTLGKIALVLFGMMALKGTLERRKKRRLVEEQSGPESSRPPEPKVF